MAIFTIDNLFKVFEIAKFLTFTMSIVFLRETVVYLLRSNKYSYNAVTKIETHNWIKWKFISYGLKALIANWTDRPITSNVIKPVYYESDYILGAVVHELGGQEATNEEINIMIGRAITCGYLSVTFATIAPVIKPSNQAAYAIL